MFPLSHNLNKAFLKVLVDDKGASVYMNANILDFYPKIDTMKLTNFP